MFFYEGLSCPVCGKAFAERDDIVACPQCGAPHHRACWEQNGHCHFGNNHGTTQQWTRPTEMTSDESSSEQPVASSHACPRCGAENSRYAEFCARCGCELHPADWQTTPSAEMPPIAPPIGGQYSEYSPFPMPVVDPYAGVPKDEEVDGVKAEDLVLTVRTNTAYYLPHFRKIAHGSRLSWNWCAFLFAPYWLLFRKNYLAGILMLMFTMAQSLLNDYVYYLYVYPLIDAGATSVSDLTQALLQSSGFMAASWMIMLLLVANMLLRVILGLTGNALYLRTCTGLIRKAQQGYPEGYKAQLSAVGGVSPMLVLIAIMATQFVGLLLSYFWA